MSRHKEDGATVDIRRALTKLAIAFNRDYHLKFQKNGIPTFGNVLYGLRDDKTGRKPAEPRDGISVAINDRLTLEEWAYFKALNTEVNSNVHSDTFRVVGGNPTIVLLDKVSDGMELYNPPLFESVLSKMRIIDPDEEGIVFQKETDFSSPVMSEKGSLPSNSGAPENP